MAITSEEIQPSIQWATVGREVLPRKNSHRQWTIGQQADPVRFSIRHEGGKEKSWSNNFHRNQSKYKVPLYSKSKQAH